MDSRLATIHQRLIEHYDPNASLLHYRNAFELLIAVSLSAQTTDNQVNQVTPLLFERFPDPHAMAAAEQKDVEEIIHSTGFYKNKAKNCIGAAKILAERFSAKVPHTMEELVQIPGIGRKSAGVILHHIYGQPAIIVDTHFGRVINRLAMSSSKNPGIIEKDVSRLIPPELWSSWSMTANLHGRALCHARNPQCNSCFLQDLCPKIGVKNETEPVL